VLECEVFVVGLSVRVNAETVYEPDVLLRCGARLGDDVVEISDPTVVIEVSSASTQSTDAAGKLADYFQLASVRHYLIVHGKQRTIIHHERGGIGEIATRIIREGGVRLDPPGVVLEGVFGD